MKSETEQKIKVVGGIKFVIYNEQEHMQSFLAGGEFYEQDMLRYIKENYNGGTFVDVGACIGNHTLCFSFIGDKVYSFEPVRVLFLRMLQNVLINKRENK